MYKTLLAVVLSLALLTAACGGKKDSGQGAPAAPAATPAAQQSGSQSGGAAQAPAAPSGSALAAEQPPAAAPATGEPRPIRIEAASEKFSISQLKAKVSETLKVTLLNNDEDVHNLVLIDHAVVSPDVGPGEEATFDWTMPDKPGSYRVVCAYHPDMEISLAVE